MSGRSAWAGPRGPMPDHATAILGRLQTADTDKDGKLSRSEAPTRLQEHFDKIDLDKDGKLDKAELGKALSAMGRHVRESMEKRRDEMVKRVQEARSKLQDKATDKAAAEKHAEKHAAPKKPIDKKIEEKKSGEKKPEVKKAAEKKVPEKKAATKKPKATES